MCTLLAVCVCVDRTINEMKVSQPFQSRTGAPPDDPPTHVPAICPFYTHTHLYLLLLLLLLLLLQAASLVHPALCFAAAISMGYILAMRRGGSVSRRRGCSVSRPGGAAFPHLRF